QQSLSLVQYVISRHGGELFYCLRHDLNLPTARGTPTLVGLHTLLDGAHFEFRGMALSFLLYLRSKEMETNNAQLHFELTFPHLFQKYTFQELATPEFAKPWINVEFCVDDISPDTVKHSFAKLGLTSDVKHLADVIQGLFTMLNSPDLLDNFQTIVKQMSPKQQRNQGVTSTATTPATPDSAQHQRFRAFMHQFWFEVIGGGEVEQLRYYLFDMLTFDVIPSIIGQMLESGRSAEALMLARHISQMPDFTKVVKAYTHNAPNLFEFIVFYAAQRLLKGFEHLLPLAQSDGNVDVQFMYNCFEGYEPDSLWEVLADIFPLSPPPDGDLWQDENDSQCKPLLSKYMRSYFFDGTPYLFAYFHADEDTSDLLWSDTGLRQGGV
ncbi:hypothetical protein H4R34_005342, partial [Dimargaris verticillata]